MFSSANVQRYKNKYTVCLLLLSFLILCFIWPVQSNILPANRNFIIYLSVILTLFLYSKKKYIQYELDQGGRYGIYLLVAFLVFTLVNGFFVAPNLLEMVRSWQGQYLRAGLLFFVGLYLYPICSYHFKGFNKNKLFSYVILSSLIIVFIQLLQFLYFYLKTGELLWGETWSVPSRTEMSFQINLVTGLLLAEIACRVFLHRQFLIFKTWLITTAIILCFICSVIIKTRWGTVGMIGSTISICFFIALKELSKKNLPKLLSAFVLITITVGAIGYTSWHQDSRWKTLSMDMVAGWNIDMHSRCYNGFDGPAMQDKNGRIMDDSNSCRASFFHQGIELITENPFGSGPRKDAFLVLLQKEFNDPIIQQSNSHYGLIDVTLQNGVLGLIIWLAFVFSMILIGWRKFSRESNVIGLYLSLFTVSFLFRSSVDNMMRDHFLEQNLALTGLMLGLIFTPKMSRDEK
ncbi:O-antigen ligase family protein [Cedecea neteri]|uniref:O-antigen ligase-related domain-containing protein n=1 Tax=Cedecea neteri TaxID=158822 RepID=A0A291E4Q5_9ENTR|nr:O-antigen ligase family protein [Cedecea neteri]ATF94879.1 hypothetical protein CO704_23770 [Cedecea neteri]